MATRPVVPAPVQVDVVTQGIGGSTRAFVVPPHINIGQGPTQVPSVRWTNRTDAPARLWFPNGDELFDPPPAGFANPIGIPAGGELILNVRKGPNPDTYHYHIYCEAVWDCAQGNSEPDVSCP